MREEEGMREKGMREKGIDEGGRAIREQGWIKEV